MDRRSHARRGAARQTDTGPRTATTSATATSSGSPRPTSPPQLDETDRLLLLALDEDPRMTTMALAQRCGLARGTVHARLERFRERGILRLNSARVDPATLGRPMLSLIHI